MHVYIKYNFTGTEKCYCILISSGIISINYMYSYVILIMSGIYKKAKLNWKVTKITMSITILIES